MEGIEGKAVERVGEGGERVDDGGYRGKGSGESGRWRVYRERQWRVWSGMDVRGLATLHNAHTSMGP